jgi:hypothetical protein
VHTSSIHIIGNYMGKLLSMIPTVVAALLLLIIQQLPSNLSMDDFKGDAGLYAFLFLVFKELMSLAKSAVLTFKKDPNVKAIEHKAVQLERQTVELSKQSVILQEHTKQFSEFLATLKETEMKRYELIQQFAEMMKKVLAGVSKINKPKRRRN